MRVKLKDVCTFYTGTGFPKKYQGQLSGTYPFYKVGDIANNVVSGKVYLEQCNNYISEETLELIKGSIIPKNTIVFAKIGEALKLNRRAITSTDCLIDNNAMGIAAKSDKLRTLFFYYFMRNIKMELLAESTTVPSVRKSRLEAYEIDIPSLDEQKIIEGKLTILSKVINLKEKQLLKLDELVKARFVEMFGDPVLNDKSWQVIKLGELCSKICSGNTPKGGSDNYKKEGIMFFRSQNVWKNRLELDDIVYIDEATHERMKETSLNYGDILITKTGRINTENSSLGRSALFLGKNGSANINGHVYLVRINSELVNRNFVLQILISPQYRDLIRRVCVGGIDKRQLNQNHIYDFPIIVPPLELQNQFASFVEEIDKSRSRIQKSLEASQELFDSLMQEYFG